MLTSKYLWLLVIAQTILYSFATPLRVSSIQAYIDGDSRIVSVQVENVGTTDITVLTRNTILEKRISTNCLNITDQYGRAIVYEGPRYSRVAIPLSNEYQVIQAGHSILVDHDISDLYPEIRERGTYSISVHSVLYYYEGAHSTVSDEMLEVAKHQLLTSDAVELRAHVSHGVPFKRGAWSTAHLNISEHSKRGVSNRPYPVTPTVSSDFTSDQRITILKAHQAATVFMWATLQKIAEPIDQQYTNWFGTYSSAYYNTIVGKLTSMSNGFTGKAQDYQKGSSTSCGNGVCAYVNTVGGSIYICDAWFSQSFSGVAQGQYQMIIHEMSHATVGAEDPNAHGGSYGTAWAKQLAINHPEWALQAAENLAYYSVMALPLNYGFDAAVVLPNGRLYASIGPIFFRYASGSSSTIDSNYPQHILGNWGSINWYNFDSMTVVDGKTYITNGNVYARFSDSSAGTVDFINPISGNWGNTPFTSGFDSMVVLPQSSGNKLFVTRGNQYVRYSGTVGTQVDSGYPKSISGNWGNLPTDFNNKFDCMLQMNSKIFVFNGKSYVRYSDSTASVVDSGYPKPIAGNWGSVPYYQ